jgi:hypothetical protein
VKWIADVPAMRPGARTGHDCEHVASCPCPVASRIDATVAGSSSSGYHAISDGSLAPGASRSGSKPARPHATTSALATARLRTISGYAEHAARLEYFAELRGVIARRKRMRPWLVLLAVGTAHADIGADDGWRYTSRQVDIHPSMERIPVRPAPPLAVFTRPGTLYMLDVDGLQCRAWTIDPQARKLVGPVALDYESSGDRLALCGMEWPDVCETAEGVEAYGAVWFHDAKSCIAARAEHRRVATDLAGCLPTKPSPAPNSRARLEHVLGSGGSLYTIVDDNGPRCGEVTVVPDSRTHGEFRFALRGTDLRGRPIRGTTTWQYYFTPGTDTIGVTDGSTGWSDGSGMGTLCAHDQPIALRRDSADIGGRYYFTVAACRAGIAAARERASWLAHAPQPPPSSPDFGGC